MRYGVLNFDNIVIRFIIFSMNSTTQNLAAAGIRYRLYLLSKSQRWLAKQLGWGVSRLAHRLAGKPVFDVEELDKIADALGVSLEELLTLPDDVYQKFFRNIDKDALATTPVGKAA